MHAMRVAIACGLCLIAAALLGGCTPVVRVEQLVPEGIARAPAPSSSTLAVAPVIGGQPSESMTRVIANVEGGPYRDALVSALDAAGLYREVRAGDDGDLVLRTEIISQDATYPPNVYTLLVHYELREARGGRVLWSSNVYSDALASEVPHDAIGANWLPTVRARTVQGNLRQLIAELSELPGLRRR